MKGIRSWWQFSFWLWTQRNSVESIIRRKTINTIVFLSVWKELEKYFSECTLQPKTKWWPKIFPQEICPKENCSQKIKQNTKFRNTNQYLTRTTGPYVKNPNPSEASYKTKQHSYLRTKLFFVRTFHRTNKIPTLLACYVIS